MEPSEEIRRIVERWLVANREETRSRDGEDLGHAGLLAIGTDDQEWWSAPERAVWRRQIEEAGGFPIEWSEIEAWEEGTVGWAGHRLSIRSLTESTAQPSHARRRTSSISNKASGRSCKSTGRSVAT